MPPGGRRVQAEDSDPDSDIDSEEAPIFDPAQAEKEEMKKKLMMMELGNDRVHQLTASGKSVRYEDKTNIRKVHAARRVNQEGTEEARQGRHHRSQLAAWNNPVTVGEYGAPVLDDFNFGQEHRQRLINDLAAGDGKDPTNETPLPYLTHGGNRNGGSRGGGYSVGGRPRIPPSRQPVYRPLDPAVDSELEHGYKNRTRLQGGNTGRADSGAGRFPARGAQHNDYAAGAGNHSSAVAARFRGGMNPHNMLAAPHAFMAHVNNMRKSKENTPSSTNKPKRSTPATTFAKGCSSSQWAIFPGSNDTEAKKTPASKQLQTSPEGGFSEFSQLKNVNIDPTHPIPMSESAMPSPHRGDTDSWTDGVLSPASLDLDSLLSGTSQREIRQSPIIIDDKESLSTIGINVNATGLGLSDALVLKKPKSKSPHENDNVHDESIIDLNDEGIDEAKIPSLNVVQERIQVSGHWYVLDKSTWGNPLRSPIPAAEPGNGAFREQKKGSSRVDIIGNRSMQCNPVQTQIPPSLGQSKFASLATSFPFKKLTVGNPFSQPKMSSQAPAAQISRPTEVKALSNEFVAFAVNHPDEERSSLATAFHSNAECSTTIKPTSCLFSDSASSTPILAGNLVGSDCGTLAALINNISNVGSRDVTSKTVACDPSNRIGGANVIKVPAIDRDISVRYVGSAPIQVTPLTNGIVDAVTGLTLEERMVRLTQVGSNAGLTPFGSSAPIAARHGRGSVSVSIASSESPTSSARRSINLTGSIYAPADAGAQFEKKSFSALKPKDGNGSGKKSSAESKTASAIFTSNANPNSASATTISPDQKASGAGAHPGQTYKELTRIKKHAPGAGFKLLREQIAAAAAAAAFAATNIIQAPSPANADDSSSEL